MARKKSFFERLTGSSHVDEYDDDFDELEEELPAPRARMPRREQIIEQPEPQPEPERTSWMPEEPAEGQLAVDVYQTPDEIIIRTLVAGVRPDDLDVSISRDMVVIKGKREESREVSDENFFARELYWGVFSRTIMLPQEIEVEDAEAVEKYGMLTIRLPKVNKEKQTRLKVKSN